MTDELVGMIGIGAMGEAAAQRFLECGIRLVVHNRSQAAADRLAASGATVAGSPSEVARRAKTVITMLPDSGDVRAVFEGPTGVFAGAAVGNLLIDCSTVNPEVSRDLARLAAEAGLRFCDAGVGGLPVDARAGTLTVMYGAHAVDARNLEDALAPVARVFFHCGPPGTGVTTKVVNNLLSNAIHVANLEAIVLAERAGLDIHVLLQILKTTAADNRQLHQRIPAELLETVHAPGFKVDLAYKDVDIGLALASARGVPVPVLSSAKQILGTARDRGRGSLAVTVLLQTLREIVSTG